MCNTEALVLKTEAELCLFLCILLKLVYVNYLEWYGVTTCLFFYHIFFYHLFVSNMQSILQLSKLASVYRINK